MRTGKVFASIRSPIFWVPEDSLPLPPWMFLRETGLERGQEIMKDTHGIDTEDDSFLRSQPSKSFFFLITLAIAVIAAVFVGMAQAEDPTFEDVPFDHPYHDYIEALYQNGYIAGCSETPKLYCPERIMDRAESAVFVDRGEHGAEFDPPDPTEEVFVDVALDAWYADWIHQLWEDNFTAGCATNPLAYCPDWDHTRAEGCVFFLRMMYGADYEPSPAEGIFADVDYENAWYGDWVDACYQAGIAEPCATDPEMRYCPEEGLTRAVAAYMMVQAKDVPLPTPTPMPSPVNGGLLVDHYAAQAFNQIPDEWLERAKELTFHYAHTSHGSQIMSGLQALADNDPKYAMTQLLAGSTPPSTLNCSTGSLCIYDGNPPETYITPEDYWSTEGGKDRARAVADTDLFDFSMWAWCAQQSSNSEETVNQYLNTMDGFEQEYPSMRFILMTGHSHSTNQTLIRNNNIVLNYAGANDKIIFDFADIERYDPAGNYYPNADDACDWCTDWCNAHPENCQDLPGSCAHSHPLQCKLKAQAFWWMMARLAGWDGTPAP